MQVQRSTCNTEESLKACGAKETLDTKIFRFGVVEELAAGGCASVPPFLPATPTNTRTSMPTKDPAAVKY